MPTRLVRGAFSFACQHAMLHLRQAQAMPAARCDGGRKVLHVGALHPPPASVEGWTAQLAQRRRAASGQHSRVRCYSQRPDGPRSLQSLAEERRRQAQVRPGAATPRDQRRQQHYAESSDDMPVERERSTVQRTWGARAAKASRHRARSSPEQDGDESASPAQARMSTARQSWTRKAAEPYRRHVARAAAEDSDEEDTQPDSQTMQCAPFAG